MMVSLEHRELRKVNSGKAFPQVKQYCLTRLHDIEKCHVASYYPAAADLNI